MPTNDGMKSNDVLLQNIGQLDSFRPSVVDSPNDIFSQRTMKLAPNASNNSRINQKYSTSRMNR